MENAQAGPGERGDVVSRERVLVELSRLALAGTEPAALDARARELVAAFEREPVTPDDVAVVREEAEDICRAARLRFESEHALRQSEARLAEAQRIGRMGSYDWDIDDDRNTWSDELYRIYGVEPQSFNASYERFMAFVHPDDREAVMAVHARVLATCEPYQMEERIIRPDGEVRLLRTWGEVLTNEAGRPVRIRGICQDVTEQRQAEEALRRSMERFETLIEATPDAVLVVDADGAVVHANAQTAVVLGYLPDELLGQPVEVVVPERLRAEHVRYRARFMAAPRNRAMGANFELFALRKDGTEVPVEVALAVLGADDGRSVAVFVRDITERRRAEQLALELHDAIERRRHALEINDNVVQGLAACQYLFDAGRTADGCRALGKTLTSAKMLMSDLLGGEGEAGLAPGALVRAKAAPALLDSAVEPSLPDGAVVGAVRVVVADDVADLRATFRMALELDGRFRVVGEAADGDAAVELTVSLRPDVTLVDLAMPGMDGLEAIAQIRARCPDVRIVALSGFDETRLGPLAAAAGADAYIEKGGSLDDLVARIAAVVGARGGAPEARAAAGLPPPPEDEPLPTAMLLHELRTPLAVVDGAVRMLRRGRDRLSDEAVAGLLAALERSAWHLNGVVESYTDAAGWPFAVESAEVDVGALIRELVDDIAMVSPRQTIVVAVDDGLRAWADAVRVRQIVSNVLTNALRHTPPGTTVTVTARREGTTVAVVCEDDGPGVPADRRARMFGRLGPGTGRSGIGLHLSARLARAMDGDLGFEEPPGGGSRFVLRVPAVDVAAAGAAASGRQSLA